MDERLRLRGDTHAARGVQARLERVLVAVPVDVVPRDMEAVQVVEAREQTMREDELPQREAVVRLVRVGVRLRLRVGVRVRVRVTVRVRARARARARVRIRVRVRVRC